VRVTYTLGKMTFAQEVKSEAEAFEFIAGVMAVFNGEPCGCCGSTETFPQVQKGQHGTFRKFSCAKCTATILLPARREDGGLFYSRTDKDRNPLPHKGWSVYKRDGQQRGSQPSRESDLPVNEDSRTEGGEVPF